MVLGMQQLWLTIATLVCLAGCSVRNVEGRWLGAMPFEDADQCQVLLQKGAQFQFGCTPGETGWSGRGTWRQGDQGVELVFDRVWRGDQLLARVPLPLRALPGESGNELVVDGAVWRRSMQPAVAGS